MTLDFTVIADRLAAAQRVEEVERIGRALAPQLASDDGLLFRLRCALDARRAELA